MRLGKTSKEMVIFIGQKMDLGHLKGPVLEVTRTTQRMTATRPFEVFQFLKKTKVRGSKVD